MKRLMSFLFLFACVVLFSGCGSGSSSSTITVTFSPSDGDVNQSLAVAITVEFSDAITEPSDWQSAFTAKKEGSDATICTVSYDATTRIATCAHDDLEASADYTLAVTGISGVDDASAIFTALTQATVSSVSKSSRVTASEGAIILTYVLDVEPISTPSFTVVDSDGSDHEVSCELAVTIFECTVSGVAGCNTFKDYTATIGDSVTEHEIIFNSADNEFDSQTQLTNCWTLVDDEGGSTSIANGALTLSLPAAASDESEAWGLPFSGLSNYAFSFYLYSAERNGSSNNEMGAAIFEAESDAMIYSRVLRDTGNKEWQAGYENSTSLIDEEIFPSGILADTITDDPPFYGCFVKYGDDIKYFISFDGETYTQLSSANMTCGGTCDDIFTGSWDTVPAQTLNFFGLAVEGADPVTSTLSGTYNYARFRTSGLTGEGAVDCPSLDID